MRALSVCECRMSAWARVSFSRSASRLRSTASVRLVPHGIAVLVIVGNELLFGVELAIACLAHVEETRCRRCALEPRNANVRLLFCSSACSVFVSVINRKLTVVVVVVAVAVASVPGVAVVAVVVAVAVADAEDVFFISVMLANPCGAGCARGKR